MKLKEKLQRIYKANDCTDVVDVNIALREVRILAGNHGWTPALMSRFLSLAKRKLKLL